MIVMRRGLWGLAMAAALLAGACTENVAGGAAEGAGRGAAAGAIGALVVGVIFDDPNIGERMARSAVAGAAIGGTVGAAQGADKDARGRQAAAAQEQFAANEAELAELRREVGDEVYLALLDLAACDRERAVAAADRIYAASEDRTKVYALYVKAIAAADAGDTPRAMALYAELAVRDPEAGDAAHIRRDVEEMVAYIRAERARYDVSPTCAA